MSENSLELHLPDRSAVSDGSFATTPNELNSWLKRLPLADAGESSRQIFEAIFELNRLDIPHLARIKIAELFLQPVAYLSDNLKKCYLELAFPLSEKNRKIALLDRELHAELAISYKLIIDQLIRVKKRRSDRKLLVIAIHRAIRCLSRVLYRSVVVYEPYPQGTWNELHGLFAYAEKNQILDLPVKEAEENSENATIGDLYGQILLFSISSPYRLRQKEIEYIQLQLPAWARLTSLGRLKPHAQSIGLFITRLDSDLPPIHRDLQSGGIEKGCRELNTRRLVQWLGETLDHPPLKRPAGENLGVDERAVKQLNRQMIQAFSTMRKRKFLRTQLDCELINVVGIPALHATLNAKKLARVKETESQSSPQEQEFDWFQPPHNRPLINTMLYTSEESTAYKLMHLDGGEQNLSNPRGVDHLTQHKNQPSYWAIDSEEVVAEPFSCTTVNQSANGYCIRWQGSDAPRLRVGEILGIQSASDQNIFNIGVSRWLKHIPGVGLSVGMELISPSAAPVSARLSDASDHTQPPREGLLLPELKTSNRPATLILPAIPFKTGDQLSIDDGSRERQVRLTRLLESTGSFAHFQFDQLDDGRTE